MQRRPPRATRTDTLFPYTTLFRSVLAVLPVERDAREIDRALAFPAPVERDALAFAAVETLEPFDRRAEAGEPIGVEVRVEIFARQAQLVAVRGVIDDARERRVRAAVLRIRSEEGRVGKECVSTFSSRWWP